MRSIIGLSSLVLCLCPVAATASELTDPFWETPTADERPAADTKRVEPPKAGSSGPVDAQSGGGTDNRGAEKDVKRRTPGFRLKLPAEML